ncbi:MAG: hypothetical protein ACE5JQ_08205 [Candidatus Methylomirabilales bacterium]
MADDGGVRRRPRNDFAATVLAQDLLSGSYDGQETLPALQRARGAGQGHHFAVTQLDGKE